MKTVNVLTRKMGDFNVFQRTSDGYFEAYELVRQWNSLEGNEQRKIEFGYIITEEQLRDYLYKVLRSKKALPL